MNGPAAVMVCAPVARAAEGAGVCGPAWSDAIAISQAIKFVVLISSAYRGLFDSVGTRKLQPVFFCCTLAFGDCVSETLNFQPAHESLHSPVARKPAID
jgi:hypothetical protein